MPPKGHSRRSTRGAKPSSAPDSSNGAGAAPPHGSGNAAFKEDEPVKPRRGAKGRTSSYQLDEPKPSGRGSKLAHPPSPPDDTAKEDEDEESGETRCICDQAEAETKDMGFMVQCEECDVWQHGICMGIEREEDCPDKYYCELCRPDLHPSVIELAKRSKSHNKKSKSIHSSRTSRSTSPLPDSRRTSGAHGSAHSGSKAPPKRRNTMNSRDPDHLAQVLDLSRKEAERAGLIPEGGSGGAGSAIGDDEHVDVGGAGAGASGRGRKRKRAGESDAGDASRKRRVAGSPDSARSDHGITEAAVFGGRTKNAKGHSNQSPAIHDSVTPTDTTTALGRGRRARKEKEPSLDLDTGKLKHPNQYTYRSGAPIGSNTAPNLTSNNSNKVSPAKNGKGGEHGPRKSAPQSSRAGAAQNQSPSPVPLSYNVPDHFSHLVPLLPHPTPQGISVPIRVELVRTVAEGTDGEDNPEVNGAVHTRVVPQTEKGVKVRWPPKRTTIGEMRRRVRAMMEYVARAQLDAGERERRVEMLKAATKVEVTSALRGAERESIIMSSRAEEREQNGNSHSMANLALDDIEKQAAPTIADAVSALFVSRSTASTSNSTLAAFPIPQPSPTHNGYDPGPPTGPTTTQLLDELTRELIQFQERFGAGREGKVYPSNRAETRERRTRNAAPIGVPDPDMF